MAINFLSLQQGYLIANILYCFYAQEVPLVVEGITPLILFPPFSKTNYNLQITNDIFRDY